MSDFDKKIDIPECGYQIKTIYFYLTEGCNLKCRHCWIAPKFQNEHNHFPYLELDLFKSIILQGERLGMDSVKLTGGEPLIHPYIADILNFIRERNLKLIIETNGIKCTSDIAHKISKCLNPFVSVSLDGSDSYTHEWMRGVEGAFDAALSGARNLVKAGIRPQIIMSIMKHNACQIEEIIQLAEKENFESVKFNIVTPTARGEQMHNSGDTLSMKELVAIGNRIENDLIPNYKIRISHSHPIAFVPLNRLMKGKIGRCGIFNIIGVLSSGKYALCGIGETVFELIFGNAVDDKLSDIWNNNHVLNDIRSGLPSKLTGICGDCVMKRQCLGTCIAMNYYRTQNLFGPQWYCAEAHKAGLFPKSRIIPNSNSNSNSDIN